MTVTFRNPDATVVKLPVKFTGQVDGDQLDMEITLPLGKLNKIYYLH